MVQKTTDLHSTFRYLYEELNDYGVSSVKSKDSILLIMGNLRADRRSNKFYSDTYYTSAINAGQWYLDRYYPPNGISEVDGFGF